MAERESNYKFAKAKRGVLRRSVTLESNKVNAEFSQITEANCKAATILRDKLQQLRNDLPSLDAIVGSHLAEVDESELETDISRSAEYQAVLVDAVATLAYNLSEFQRQQHSPSPVVPPPVVDTRGARHKLLDVDIVKFQGDPTHWEEFIDDFTATVDLKPQYTKVEKFKILKASLEGEPKEMIRGLLLTDANFQQAKDMLEERYANKQQRRFAHFDELLAIPPVDHQTPKLRELRDKCEAHMRSLVALGYDEDKFGELFIPILLRKLPKFVKLEICRKKGRGDWTLQKFRDLLKEEIEVRDSCEQALWKDEHRNTTHNMARGSRCPSRPPEPKKANQTLVTEGGKAPAPNKGSNRRRFTCIFCQDESHASRSCHVYPDVRSRFDRIKDEHCTACFRKDHRLKDCKSPFPCRYCRTKGHHNTLCPTYLWKEDGQGKSTDKANVVFCEEVSKGTLGSELVGVATSDRQLGRAVMETAEASVVGTRSQAKARLLFDTASTLSFITSSLARQVGAKHLRDEASSVGRFRDSKRSTMVYKVYEVDVLLPSGERKGLTVYGVDVICTPVQLVPLAASHRSVVSSIQLADPLSENPKTVQIDILVGLNAYHGFFEDAHIRLTDQLVLKKSVLGWVASGFDRDNEVDRGDNAHLILAADVRKSEMFDVERFWALDEIGIKDDPGSVDDETALKFFNDTIKFEHGRYQVKWPYKDPNPNLPTNRNLALRRLKSLCGKLKGQPEMLFEYDKVIRDQLNRQMIEVASEVPDGLEHYLPHHGVLKASSATTKLRIVFDASAKSHKHALSLNDCLFRGPVLMSDLCGILVRSRLHPIGILSDVEKAYLQVGLQVEDRDVARFFWLNDPRLGFVDGNIVCFRFTRVLFGVRPSAFMLAGTLAHHIQKSKQPVAPELDGNIYVDNLFVGKHDAESAVRFYHEAKSLLAEASMNLREWFSNCKKVVDAIPQADRGKGEVTQLLGLKWHVEADQLSTQPKFKDAQQPMTKRMVLVAIASIYDPCGWFCPLVILGRILMQDLWLRKIDWDEPIPEDLRDAWGEVWHSLQGICEFRLQRCIDPSATLPETVVELHTFTDASARAYAAATFVRVHSPKGVTCNLVFAKARVSPVKQKLTIPRLELVGVVVGLRLLHFVAKELRLPLARRVVWTDSKCLLHWIQSKEVQTKFVENRLSEIRQSLDEVEFRYVPTAENPADIPTRGTDIVGLKTNELWWSGPEWLRLSENHWPQNIEVSSVSEEPKVAPDNIVATAMVEKSAPLLNVLDFSDLTRMLRVTAYVRRAVLRFKGHTLADSYVDATELDGIEKDYIRQAQRECIPEFFRGELPPEMENLRAQLGLHLDKEGIVRCRGHLDSADLPLAQKRPVFLSTAHPFTILAVRRAHRRVMHSGTAHTLAETRTQFWIPRDRTLAKQTVSACKNCWRFKGGPFRVPDPPPLPTERSTQVSPFAVTGLDYLGPLYVRSAKGTTKVWIVIFTCATIRAVHLEVAESYSALDFLLCFRRFVAARGVPKLVISDNGKNFLPTSQLFSKAWSKAVTSKEVKDFSSDTGIGWQFIPERAAWMGGFYERLVKPVKEALVKTLGSRLPFLKELQTVVFEISAVLNSRPLTYVEKDGVDRPLTPLDFLQVPSTTLVPPARNSSFLGRGSTAKELVEHWKQAEKVLNKYWQEWRSKYLVSLRQRYWKHNNRNASAMGPKVGTVVHIKDTMPRAKWRIGRIVGLRMSRDEVCRSVDLRLANGETIVRPIKLLYPLEHSDYDTQVTKTRQKTAQQNKRKVAKPPARVKLPVDEEMAAAQSSDDGSIEF